MTNKFPKELEEKLSGTYQGYSISKMSPSDKQFMWDMINKTKPKKIVEVGVYSGGSSAILLNAIKDIEGAQLYSNDICPTHPFLKDKTPGFIIEEKFSELKDKYNLFYGKDVSEFIEQIGDGIDLALIDTAHRHPCECLNLISILPFMKENSWVMLHDIGLFYCEDNKWQNKNCYATKYIWDAWEGEKLSAENCQIFTLPNIGAIKVENLKINKRKMIWLLFNRWDMQIDEYILKTVRKIIEKYYNKEDLELYDMIIARKKQIDKSEKDIEIKRKKIFKKVKDNNTGRRKIYFCGIKILSYKRK